MYAKQTGIKFIKFGKLRFEKSKFGSCFDLIYVIKLTIILIMFL